jgi:cell filamentation protein
MSSAERTSREQAIYDSLVYPGSDVLRNKLDITDQAALNRAEAEASALREPSRPTFQKFKLAEMRVVHKHLLGGVYDWAGQIRTYTTGRNIASFARPEYIESYFETAVFKPLQRENLLKGLGREQFAERGAHFASEVNAVHPFIDGNGRVTRLFLKDLAAQAGYFLDITRLEANKGAWYAAMKQGFERGDTSKLKREILNALDVPEKMLEKRLEAQAGMERFFSEMVSLSRAPRHDLNKSQAQMHVVATERMAENLAALKKNPALAEKSEQALEKLAYYRGILQEDVKRETPEVQQAKLAKFDHAAENPAFVERLEKSDQAQEATKERAAPEQLQERKDTYEQSL